MKVKRRPKQGGGKAADFIRRWRKAEMAGRYETPDILRGAEPIVRPAIRLNPSRVTDLRGTDASERDLGDETTLDKLVWFLRNAVPIRDNKKRATELLREEKPRPKTQASQTMTAMRSTKVSRPMATKPKPKRGVGAGEFSTGEPRRRSPGMMSGPKAFKMQRPSSPKPRASTSRGGGGARLG
jgi:hypothetical protein